MNTIEVSIFDIERDDKIQPRVELKEEVIFEYAKNLAKGVEFPPVDVFYDGEKYRLADGFHRYEAYSMEWRDTIPAKVHEGGRREAIIHAAGSNATHGIPRSNADKRRVVGNMLKDPEFNIESDNTIAEWCKVSQPFVSKMRKELTNNGYKFESVRKCADGRMMETSKIGAKPKTSETEDSQTVEEGESTQTEMELVENKEKDQVQVSEKDDAESKPDINSGLGSENDHSDDQGSSKDVDDDSFDSDEEEVSETEDAGKLEQDASVELSDPEKEETSLIDEQVDSNEEDLSLSSVEPGDPSNEGETEAGEDVADELSDINDVEILKAKIIELQNALKEKNQILHSKEDRIAELERTVMMLRGKIKYYNEEIRRLDEFKAKHDVIIPKSSGPYFRQSQERM